MKTTLPLQAGDAGQAVLITRTFNAPRELVFAAWADPEQLQHWYAPHGCATRFLKFDFHEGGTFHSCIRIPNGHECWCVGEFREIVRPERIVYTMAVANAQGRRLSPLEAGMDPEWPEETVVTVTLEETAGQTRLTLHQTVSEALAKRTGAHPSWLQMLDRLEEVLSKG